MELRPRGPLSPAPSEAAPWPPARAPGRPCRARAPESHREGLGGPSVPQQIPAEHPASATPRVTAVSETDGAPSSGAGCPLAGVTGLLWRSPRHPAAELLPTRSACRSLSAHEAGCSERAGLWGQTVLGQIPALPLTSRVTSDEALHLSRALLSRLKVGGGL